MATMAVCSAAACATLGALARSSPCPSRPSSCLAVCAPALKLARGPQSWEGAPGQSLRARAHRGVAAAAAVAGQEAFAQEETAKFLKELPELLEREAPGGGDAAKAAQVCSEALSGFLKTYSGQIEPEPFAAMKEALSSQGVPAAYVDKVLFCAIGWARGNLYGDWKKWSGGK